MWNDALRGLLVGSAGALGASLWLAGCASAPTQLLVVIDSDLAPSELARVRVTAAESESGRGVSEANFGVDAPLELPFSLGVRPALGATALGVIVRADGLDASGQVVVRRAIRTEFRTGRTLLITLPLARACAQEPPCEDADQTCVDGACASALVSPASLVEVGPDATPSRLFEGVSDGGLEDAPPCPAAEACVVPGEPCGVGVRDCATGSCARVSSLPEGTSCGDGRACDATGACVAASFP